MAYIDDQHLPGMTFGSRLQGWLADPIVQCLAFIVIVSLVFVIFPAIDAWFSGLFALANKGGFPIGNLAAFQFLRNVNRWLTAIIPTILIIVLVIKVVRPDRRSLVPPAYSVFLLSTLAIGSGIVANLIFKDHWGRPRPVNVDIFGGNLPFVPAWRVTSECAANCSFVSGEGSSSIWLLGLAVLVPREWRGTALRWLLVFAAAVSLDRIAFGGHFLSDVLLAWGFTLLIMAVVYRYVIEQPLPWFANERLEADLTRFGIAIRRRLGFPTPGIEEPPALEPPPVVTPPPRDDITDLPLAPTQTDPDTPIVPPPPPAPPLSGGPPPTADAASPSEPPTGGETSSEQPSPAAPDVGTERSSSPER